MTTQKKKERPVKNGSGKGTPDLVELITGRVGKITALVGAVGGLILLIMTQVEQISDKLPSLGLSTPSQCVVVDEIDVPDSVNFSEWENMKIKIKGRNKCSEPLGLYVTFLRHKRSHPSFDLRIPVDDPETCKGVASLRVPACWERKMPIDKPVWEWEVFPPPLQSHSDPRKDVEITFTWSVRNMNDPDAPDIRTDSKVIKVICDVPTCDAG